MTDIPTQEREQCLRLVAGGPGWDPYTLDKAQRLAVDPDHAGLVEAVESAMGEQRAQSAHAVLAWFRRSGT